MNEIQKIIKLVEKFRYDNPLQTPTRIFMTNKQLLQLQNECDNICPFRSGSDNISAIFGMVITVIPDNSYLVEE